MSLKILYTSSLMHISLNYLISSLFFLLLPPHPRPRPCLSLAPPPPPRSPDPAPLLRVDRRHPSDNSSRPPDIDSKDSLSQ